MPVLGEGIVSNYSYGIITAKCPIRREFTVNRFDSVMNCKWSSNAFQYSRCNILSVKDGLLLLYMGFRIAGPY